VKENRDFQNRLRRSSPISEPLYSESGVDLTLIRWMLSLTPAERLQILQQTVRSILRLKGCPSLEKLIELKEELGSEMDKATLPVLRQTLLEKGKRRGQKK